MFTTRTARATDDIDQISQLQQHYAQAYPPRTPVPAPLYLSPYFEEGKNVLCAFDTAGTLIAYAPYFPQNDQAWVEVEALPGLENAIEVKDTLWAWIIERAQKDGKRTLSFQYYPNEKEAIVFAQGKGAQHHYGIFTMRRDLELPIPVLAVPSGLSLRQWLMESEAEQMQYLEGRNDCFPEAPLSLEEWQYFTQAPLWEQGVNMAAFAGERFAASVLVFWEPGSATGSTEYVFTRREYRHCGLSRFLLAESLRYLKEHGLHQAALEVRVENRSALGVYLGLGYEVTAESGVYEVNLP